LHQKLAVGERAEVGERSLIGLVEERVAHVLGRGRYLVSEFEVHVASDASGESIPALRRG
jgi:hypothetical protein